VKCIGYQLSISVLLALFGVGSSALGRVEGCSIANVSFRRSLHVSRGALANDVFIA
jgi:hypothetical protein